MCMFVYSPVRVCTRHWMTVRVAALPTIPFLLRYLLVSAGTNLKRILGNHHCPAMISCYDMIHDGMIHTEWLSIVVNGTVSGSHHWYSALLSYYDSRILRRAIIDGSRWSWAVGWFNVAQHLPGCTQRAEYCERQLQSGQNTSGEAQAKPPQAVDGCWWEIQLFIRITSYLWSNYVELSNLRWFLNMDLPVT